MNRAGRLYGESAITAASIFEAMGRSDKPYWDELGEAAPTIILWEGPTQKDKNECLKETRTSNGGVIWFRSRRKGNEELEQHLRREDRKVFNTLVYIGKGGGGGNRGKEEPEEREEKNGRTI